jgi:putative glutamine amidotransferase
VTAPRRLVEGRERVTLNTAYVRALERAGLVPLAVPTMLAPDHAAAALTGVRGLVLTGGEDVAPDRARGTAPAPRGGRSIPRCRRGGADRRGATARPPILAICRGSRF